jgi:hypothetical protein
LALLLGTAGQDPAGAPGRWIELGRDPLAARRGCAIRYVPDAGAFFLWGSMTLDPEFPQEYSLMEVPEYDVAALDPADGRWRSHLPRAVEEEWTRKLPPSYVPRTYSGITTGSERTVLRGASERGGVPRPDLNVVFDQVAYHPGRKALIYFTGGLTAAYAVVERRWTDLAPAHSPPPVLGGSLAYDPLNDELVLFGGGHVAEEGPGGKVVGYTGTWVYRFRDGDWHRLTPEVEPPPRLCSRLVLDARRQALVLFGGDGQSHFLADTWLYDLKTRTWRASRAPGPPARAGHFTVYDPETGWVIVGGGYNRRDLSDLWAYDAGADRWQRLPGDVPAGFYLTADLAPEKRLIVLVTCTRRPGDTLTCNILYPVRTTYAYRLAADGLVRPDAPVPQAPIPKWDPEARTAGTAPDAARRAAQEKRLRELPVNRWVPLPEPGRAAPMRTWGCATFDPDRGQILYWGGGHCGYEGSDVDAYDVEHHTWRALDAQPEFPERLWNRGVRLAGVTFRGAPWTEHGRKIYAYDPLSRQMVLAYPIRLTAGYEPPALASFPAVRRAAPDALVSTPSSYLRYATWTYDPGRGEWNLAGGAPAGLDTLVTTRHGVMGVDVEWRTRLNDAGYDLPWSPSSPPVEKSMFLFQASEKRWKKLSREGPSPQNLYEMTALVYDSKRDRVLLHGGGKDRDELWSFDVAEGSWKNLRPSVAAPAGAAPPRASREAVYLPSADVVFLYGPAPASEKGAAAWTYHPGENAWRRLDFPRVEGIDPRRAAGPSRALVYDPKRDLALLVLSTGGDVGKAAVFALRYDPAQARFLK